MSDKTVSRKDFLKGVGKSIAGVTLIGGVGSLLTGCAQPDAPAVDTSQAPTWPFTYSKLDPDKVAERAFNSYKTGGG